jgi:hypothetical protein
MYGDGQSYIHDSLRRGYYGGSLSACQPAVHCASCYFILTLTYGQRLLSESYRQATSTFVS